ncbi:MAG: MazG nucleotide pyrophosphohydrolase domain-containing protein, partial [Novosphingobium sp.]
QGVVWPDPSGSVEDVGEEIQELADASSDDERVAEAGDLLFAACNLVRKYGVAPEEALRQANAKFERRYRGMEKLA